MNESGQKAPEIISAAQMRAREAAAIAAGHTTGAALMEQAGQGAAAVILALSGDVAARAVVLCGPGNNGGDGYVIARHLAAAGWQVDVLASAAPRSADAAGAAARWQAAGGRIGGLAQLPAILPARATDARPQRLVLVDALLGLGQNRSPADLLAPVWRALDDLDADLPRPFVVAVDMPTGLDTDTGAALCARVISADLVITFHACKPVHGLLQAQGVAVRVVPLDL